MPPVAGDLSADFARSQEEATAALERRDWKTARELFDRILVMLPDCAEAYFGRGRALFSLGEYRAALSSYDQALRLNPAFPEAHNYRGGCLGMMGETTAAKAAFEQSLALNPDYAEAHFNLGLALATEGDIPGSLVSTERALALEPKYASALINRGCALELMGRTREALECYEAALVLHPEIPGALHSSQEANAQADTPLSLKTNEAGYAQARYNRSLCLLALGRLKEGWPEYEWRWGTAAGKTISSAHPTWTGKEPIEGKTILVFSEQGIGDNIQFCRYIPLLEKRGARVLYGLGPKFEALAGLLKGIGASFQFIDGSRPLDHLMQYDYQCAVMSLPSAFGTEVESIPAPIPQLGAPAALVSAWRKRLGRQGFKIGISWQGNPKHRRDRERSFALSRFSEIAAIPGVRLINLHKGAGEAQIARAPFKIENFSTEISLDAQGWLDTAALATACDLVICCDTALAHLAGTLGLPVWLLVTYAADWRWFQGRTDSPWYPSMRVFRQSAYGDWTSVFEEIGAALPRLISQKSERPQVPPLKPAGETPRRSRWLPWLRSSSAQEKR